MTREDSTMPSGTITNRETKDVLLDVLIARKVPSGLWSFKRNGLHMLVGSRVVVVPCRAGMSFYGVQAAIRDVEAAITDLFRAREHRNQVDIEELISKTPVPE